MDKLSKHWTKHRCVTHMISSLIQPDLFKVSVKSENGPSTPFLDFRQAQRFGTY